MHWLGLVFAVTCSVAPALAGTKLLRSPDIHGEQVAFVYGGDLWTASAADGVAARLSAHPGLEVFAERDGFRKRSPRRRVGSRLDVMTRRYFVSSIAVLGLGCTKAPETHDPTLRLTARDASGEHEIRWAPEATAIIVCDMWDDHWCKSAARRVGEMAPRMNDTLNAARALGVKIVHAPSDTLDHYAGWPQRERILAVPHAEPPVEIQRWCYLEPEKEMALPIDDSDGGCDDENPVESRPWTQQHAAIEVAAEDVVSDQGTEIYNYFVEQDVKHVALMGVHTNMCVLGRSFGIRQLTKLGFDVALVRDLTDAMYDPRDEPKVSHEEGTRLVIEHIEKHWAPTITSEDLMKAA